MAHNEDKDPTYLLVQLENISPRPIQSLGTYVSLDAECVVAGSSDKNLRFLDTDILDEIARCIVNKRSVNCVAISEMSLDGDDPIIVTGGKDSFIQIWNPTSGSLEKNIELPTNEVRSLSIYQGSETYLLIGTKDAKVILWDILKNSLVRVFEGHRASIHSVSISSSVLDIEKENDIDFLCIASGGADRTVRTWDINTGKKKKKFRHSRSISTMVVANKGIRPILATGGVERIIKLWDVDSGVLLRSLDGHLDHITTLSLWEGYQILLISGSADHTLRVYDILTGECICILVGHTEGVLACTIANYDDPIIVSSADDLSLIQWDLKSILEDFYYTKEGDENLGSRNQHPPHLPIISYVAPAELDKAQLTKEERKRIRKEQKKEKRAKNSERYSSKGCSLLPTSTAAMEEFGEGDGVNKKIPSVDYGDDDYYEGFNGFDKEDASRTPSITTTSAAATESTAPSVAPSTASGKIVPATELGIVSARKASVSMVKGLMQAFGINNSVGIDPAGMQTINIPATTSVPVVPSALVVSTTPAAVSETANLRLLANEAHNKFKIAEVQKEIEADRRKSEASQKLKLRLNLKKKKTDDGAIPMEATTAGQGEQIAEEEEAELHRVKAEKLRQHKMQENRRNQSMYVAKERSAQALQKRLDELAARKKAATASGGFNETIGAIAENSEDEEDSSDDESN